MRNVDNHPLAQLGAIEPEGSHRQPGAHAEPDRGLTLEASSKATWRKVGKPVTSDNSLRLLGSMISSPLVSYAGALITICSLASPRSGTSLTRAVLVHVVDVADVVTRGSGAPAVQVDNKPVVARMVAGADTSDLAWSHRRDEVLGSDPQVTAQVVAAVAVGAVTAVPVAMAAATASVTVAVRNLRKTDISASSRAGQLGPFPSPLHE